MKLMAVLLIAVLFLTGTYSDLDARKRRKRKSYHKESKMLPEEKKDFEKKFVYRKKYDPRYQAGAYMFLLRDDGIPDEGGNIDKHLFVGAGFRGRFDLGERWTFLPGLSYTVFSHNKVFGNHTRSLSYGLIEFDLARRISISKDRAELFLGGGIHSYYTRLSINYSSSSTNAESSTTETSMEFGMSALSSLILLPESAVSPFFLAKLYFLNPDATVAIHAGLLISF